jgi:hypothetical protein
VDHCLLLCLLSLNRIADAMASMLAESSVDRSFETWSGETMIMKLAYAAYSHHKEVTSKTDCFGIRIMRRPSGVTCLPSNCYFSELAL